MADEVSGSVETQPEPHPEAPAIRRFMDFWLWASLALGTIAMLGWLYGIARILLWCARWLYDGM
jgi:hypothetical protein